MQVQWTKLIWEFVIASIIGAMIIAHFRKDDPPPPPPPPVVEAPVVVPPPPPSLPPMKPRPKPKALNCSWVPSYAYNYPRAEVLDAVRQRGLSAAKISQLEKCLDQHGG